VHWRDVILPELTGPTRQREIEMVEAVPNYALDRKHLLTDWELKFCRSLLFNQSRRGPISEKQLQVLKKIIDRCRVEARAA
jgi:hypothetical protein